MARPSKFSEDMKDKIKDMAKRGFTDVQMSEELGVKRQTFDNWKKKYKEFFASLKDWKADADSVVEGSLYQRACGFIAPDGKYYPPDPTSMIFWLKNRQKDKWRDKQDMTINGDINSKIEVTIKPPEDE